ncbi:HD-GYP domain-containing protein [Longimicrobium sp.]|uniref:HD-GYP domain-containing protein n=1 Tax=Longimicrobium sp. TaxID=2029185 RepID=UPI002E33E8D9|nr:HD domain-containing phosphohydrolase [Longimicrobium sp.]HEX6037203.1 HD domain-containing phosphohydrolase [Longimicrobium sp.]
MTGPLRVIVADDDASIRAVLRTLLAEESFTVREAEDGVDALRQFMAGGADLIFSDLQMPGMGGLDLLRRVRAVDDTVGFIILTGAGTVENAVEALRLQADDYLVKPFHVAEVQLAAERAVSYRRLLRENRSYQQHLEERVAEQAGQIETLLMDALRSLATAIETRDDYTGGHVERVARYATATGREMGLTGEELRALWVGALLHDVGKIGVPDQVLKKPAPLTYEEYEEMKRHPEIGATIMERSSFLRPGLPAVLHHQERYDGSGYPYGLRGADISLQGRIVAVVDTFDAIVSSRPYRNGSSNEHALSEIRRNAGTQFDPDVVEAFMRAAEKGFPDDPDAPRLPDRAAEMV